MSQLKSSEHSPPLVNTLEVEPGQPLWKRVPTKDEQGNYLSDFMIIIPKLNKQGKHTISQTINRIGQVLQYYEEAVAFADLNMKTNVLWISFKPAQAMCIEISSAIITRVPGAKLVGEHPDFL